MRYIALVFVLFSVHPVHAGRFGLGFVLGDPTALSARYDRRAESAVDVQVSFNNHEYVLAYGDYLFLYQGLFGRDRVTNALTPYVGVGPLVALASRSYHGKGVYYRERDDKVAVAVRIPFGVEWRLERVPLGLGLELAPGVVVLPATTGFLQAGLTLRFYF